MTKPFHLAVFIGRFQPFHVGHLAVALDALSHADKLLILIGSANRSRDTRNPFTATERMHMISNAVYDAGVLDHTEIGFLDDHPYDMQRWIEGTQSVVADAAKALGMTDPKVMLTGHNRDLSSFYLKKFPQWTFNEAESGDTSINATAIRTAYFERVLHKNGGQYLVGRRLSYVDLSLFQIVEGLRYAFPKRMKRFEKKIPGVIALHDRVAKRPRVKAYLASKRRIAFSQWGIYRYFKELDG